ncbi:MAG: hypothetical protein AAF192_02000 [Pseudomonadota bacterium]
MVALDVLKRNFMTNVFDFENYARDRRENTVVQLVDPVAQALSALDAIAAAAADLPADRRDELALAAADIDAALGRAIRAIHAAPCYENVEKARVDTSRRPA